MSTTAAHLCACGHVKGLHLPGGQCARCDCPQFTRQPLKTTVTSASALGLRPQRRRNRQGGRA